MFYQFISFRHNLKQNIFDLKISNDKKVELIQNSNKLAETEPPEGLSESERSLISLDIKKSFVTSFDLVIVISVILSWLSSIVAYFTIKKGILKS